MAWGWLAWLVLGAALVCVFLFARARNGVPRAGAFPDWVDSIIKGEVHHFVLSKVNDLGPVFAFYLFGRPHLYVVSDIEGAKKILGQVPGVRGGHKKHFASSYEAMLGERGGKAMVSTNGQPWQARRKVTQHLFSLSQAKASQARQIKHNERLFKWIDERAGTKVDMQDLFLRYFLDYSAELLYGSFETDALNCSDVGDQLYRLLDKLLAKWLLITTPLVDVFGLFGFKIWKMLPTAQAQEYKHDEAALKTIIRSIIRTKQREWSKQGFTQDNYFECEDCMLSRYMCATNPDTGRIFEPEDLVGDAADVLVAGFDTSGHVVAFTLDLVAAHPDVARRVADEVRAVMGTDSDFPSYEMLSRMVYLDAVLKESMRMRPPGGVTTDRELVAPVEVSGHVLPKGAWVNVPQYALHMCDRHWPQPHRFDPERWLDPHSGAREVGVTATPPALGPFVRGGGGVPSPGPWLPFATGPRACLGQTIALHHMKALLARCLRKYEIESLRDSSDKLKFRFSLHFDGGCPAIFNTRV